MDYKQRAKTGEEKRREEEDSSHRQQTLKADDDSGPGNTTNTAKEGLIQGRGAGNANTTMLIE